MSVSLITGKISHIDHSTETSGHITANRGGQIQTAHAWSFRLNNRPSVYKSRQTASFSDGDELTAAGQDQHGTFMIISCRNETTGAVYESPATMVRVAAALMIVLGLPLMALIIGFLMLPLGIYFLMLGQKMAKANALLLAAPRPIAVSITR
jgi:hypothetical protein